MNLPPEQGAACGRLAQADALSCPGHVLFDQESLEDDQQVEIRTRYIHGVNGRYINIGTDPCLAGQQQYSGRATAEQVIAALGL